MREPKSSTALIPIPDGRQCSVPSCKLMSHRFSHTLNMICTGRYIIHQLFPVISCLSTQSRRLFARRYLPPCMPSIMRNLASGANAAARCSGHRRQRGISCAIGNDSCLLAPRSNRGNHGAVAWLWNGLGQSSKVCEHVCVCVCVCCVWF